MNKLEFKIISVGKLKYDRLKTLSLFRKKLNDYGYVINMSEAKDLLDIIILNEFKDRFDIKFKFCLDSILTDIVYVEYNNYDKEYNFPKDYIQAIG